MLEQEPKNKKLEVVEFTNTEKDLIKMIREKGIKNPEVLQFLCGWAEEWQKKVEQAENFGLAQIIFLCRRAKLYFEAGLLEEAHGDFEDAGTLAYNLFLDDIYEEITKEIEVVKNS